MTDASAGGDPVLGIRRAELIDLLRQGCRDVELRFGLTIVAVARNAARIF